MIFCVAGTLVNVAGFMHFWGLTIGRRGLTIGWRGLTIDRRGLTIGMMGLL